MSLFLHPHHALCTICLLTVNMLGNSSLLEGWNKYRTPFQSLDEYYFVTAKSDNCFLKEGRYNMDQFITVEEREKQNEREREGDFIKDPGLSPTPFEYVNVSGREKNTAREKWGGGKRGERDGEEGCSTNKWESDQGKESKRVRERERPLWIVSGLRHSVNRRCFCMRCQCTSLLQGIARSSASHIHRPCLPTSVSLQQPLTAGWENTQRAKEWTEPASHWGGERLLNRDEPLRWQGILLHKKIENSQVFTSSLIFFFSFASVTENMITRLNGFKPYKSVIASSDGR